MKKYALKKYRLVSKLDVVGGLTPPREKSQLACCQHKQAEYVRDRYCMKQYMKKLMLNFFLAVLGICLFSCSSTIERHISDNQTMDIEKQEALRNREVIPGMNSQEVKLILGEPKNQENLENKTIWIYEEQDGVSLDKAYTYESAFSQGIAFIVPLNYGCQELRLFFNTNNTVYKVEKILQKNSPKNREIK